jgi:hypothetical protein
MKKIIFLFLVFGSELAYSQSDTLKASQAKDFVGKEIIVKDIIAGARFFDRPDKKTFLINLAERYPNTPLTVVLYDENYTNLSIKENLDGKNIVVKGIVSVFNDKIQIVVTDLKNITIK